MAIAKRSAGGTVAYTAPFLTYVALLAIEPWIHWPAVAIHTFRFVVVSAVIWLFSRSVVPLRAAVPLASIGIGLLVFVLWIGPDVAFGYRHHWLFENALTGKAATHFPPLLQHDAFFLTIRMLTTALLVPVLEELFWRGWLMRWLIDNREFLNVPIGTYQPLAFWLVAVLFASEHGPYWEVGLLAGIIYNWWLVRTKNLADCIVAHAVTNAALGIYVISNGQWQYWL